jgi:putative addiction module component (TIGR02574 family)
MSMTLDQLKAEAMKLSPEHRADLADWLWISATPREEVEAAWDAEIARRVAAMDAGEAKFVSADKVLADMKAKLRSRKK